MFVLQLYEISSKTFLKGTVRLIFQPTPLFYPFTIPVSWSQNIPMLLTKNKKAKSRVVVQSLRLPYWVPKFKMTYILHNNSKQTILWKYYRTMARLEEYVMFRPVRVVKQVRKGKNPSWHKWWAFNPTFQSILIKNIILSQVSYYIWVGFSGCDFSCIHSTTVHLKPRSRSWRDVIFKEAESSWR